MLVFAIVLCIVLAAVCAATEHALAEASRAKIDDMLEPEKRQQVDRRLQQHDELALVAVVYRGVLETVAVVTLATNPPLGNLSLYAVFGWAVLLVVVFAEIAPRMLAARSPERALIFVLPGFHALSAPLLPLARRLLSLVRSVKRTNNQTGEEEDEAAEDILSAVAEGEKEGAIAGQQADMIESIIELRDADVAEIMTPRPDMTSVSVDHNLEDTIETVLETGHSKLPVFRDTRDDIVGIVYVRDLIGALVPSRKVPGSVSTETLMRPPYFVPETMRVSDLLRQLQERQTTMAIVIDEYGGTAGLVTISDIVGLIVGEVRDQHEPQREPVVTVIDEHTIEADAKTPIRTLNDDFGTHIPENDEYDTVAGYLCYTFGRIPRTGDQHTCGKTKILVLGADRRRVGSVGITIQSGVKKD